MASSLTFTFPQPLGIAPFPLGLLLIESDDVREALLAGVPPERLVGDARVAPAPGIAALAAGGPPEASGPPGGEGLPTVTDPALRAAFAGNVEDGVRLLDAHLAEHPDDLVAAYNRFVLDDAGVDVAALRGRAPREVAALVDIVHFATGGATAVPADDPSLPAEVRAVAGVARSSALLSEGKFEAAIDELTVSVDLVYAASPTLAAVSLDAASRLYLREGQLEPAVVALEAALELLSEPRQASLAAESALQLGVCCHQASLERPAWSQRAVLAYQRVFKYCDEFSAPETYAAAHLNLASLYLSRPMANVGDQLRYAVSMQSLKAARRVYERLGSNEQWASATINLANALVYAPSQHREDNLNQAVDLYDEVLRTRTREEQPRGHAYAQLNLANALAHLGAFDAAEESLGVAREVFTALNDGQALESLRELEAGLRESRAGGA
ncbi:hypothetical protein JT358_08205 [Micrococcales bacterium 31B]|nr:hypothetical protein [Micrococcales bacterium 31B]